MRDSYLNHSVSANADIDGVKVSGILELSENSAQCIFSNFSEFFHISEDRHLHADLETMQCATFTKFFASPGSIAAGEKVIFRSKVYAHEVIIGPRPWATTESVKTIQLDFEEDLSCLNAPDLINQLIAPADKLSPVQTLAELKIDGAKITIFIGASSIGLSGYFKPHGYNFVVEFDEGIPLESCGETISMLTAFVSFAEGRYIAPKNPQICPTSATAAANSVPEKFDIYWPKVPQPDHVNAERFLQVLRARDQDDRVVFGACLKLFCAGWQVWRGPIFGMISAMQSENVFGNSRLVDACKWLESSPGAEQESFLSKDQRLPILNAAKTAARDLGLDINDRLAGMISLLGKESRKDWIVRLGDACRSLPWVNQTKFAQDA
jgi:hypothetical protein